MDYKDMNSTAAALPERVADQLARHYGLTADHARRVTVGAGSETYIVDCKGERFVLKYPSAGGINHPELEPALCRFLLDRGLPVSEFLPDLRGEFLCREDGAVFHLQRFIEGDNLGLNKAPDWFMRESGELLGRIHAVLRDYPPLPEGIGAGFIAHMTPLTALASYERSLLTARELGDKGSAADIEYRIGLMKRFPQMDVDVARLTCLNTHGDYFISQMLCGDGRINAVIDWTTACVHPAVWEIIRSFVYAAPSAAGGAVDADELLAYTACYLKHGRLTNDDLRVMPDLFFYQIAVCDYYGQYYGSSAANREIYLRQAVFSTGLMKWLEERRGKLSSALLDAFGH